jgi:glycosyltransferase involved in cell wall biosynthesis
MPPDVSIVIPHYNRIPLIEKTLESVSASQSGTYEVIVVDDGSDPQQRRSLTSLSSANLRVVDSDGMKGPSGARNTGAQEAKSDLLFFLDSDDLLAPWCLEQRLRFVRDFPENDLWVFPVLLFHDYPGDREILWNDMEGGDDAVRFVQSDPPWHTSSPIWRRSAFLSLGGFNERIIYGDDSDLHLRALLAGLRIAKFRDALPDVFVRRSNDDRITSGMKPEIIESRLTRLSETSRLLRTRGFHSLLDIFEGQYFVEAEFLLFNAATRNPDITRVLDQWRADFPASKYRNIARWYLQLAIMMRNHAYFGLRIMRRVIRELLPATFFPTGGGIEATRADEKRMQQVHNELRGAA